MKSLVLTLLLAAAALAQVPAKSTVGILTIDVTDIQIAIPFGGTEPRALISVCSDQQFARLQVTTSSVDASGNLSSAAVYDVVAVKSGSSYCAAVVDPSPRARLSSLQAAAVTQANITASPAPLSTSENMAGKRRF